MLKSNLLTEEILQKSEKMGLGGLWKKLEYYSYYT